MPMPKGWDGGQAFPRSGTGGQQAAVEGISARLYIATVIMAAMATNNGGLQFFSEDNWRQLAIQAHDGADAVLEECWRRDHT